jgi:PAS domain S-box-containing protein
VKPPSLFGNLIKVFFGSLLLPLSIGLVFLLYSFRVTAPEKEKELERRIAEIASILEGEIKTQLGTLKALANFREILFSRECPAFLSRMMVSHPYLLNLGVIGMDGFLRCSALPVPSPVFLGDRSYFLLAVKEKDFSVGEYQVGRVTKKETINFGYPILRGAGVEGVVYEAVDLSFFQNLLQLASLMEEEIILLDRRGTVLASRVREIDAPPGVPWEHFQKPAEPSGVMRVAIVNRWYDLAVTHLSLGKGSDSLYLMVFSPSLSPGVFLWERSKGAVLVFLLFFLGAGWIGYSLLYRQVWRPLRQSVHQIQLLSPADGGNLPRPGNLPREFIPLYDVLEGWVKRSLEGKKQIEESERRYRTLLEIAPDPIAVHEGGKLTYVNREALRFIGAEDPSQVLGRSVFEFVHPEDRPRVSERIRRMLAEGRPAERIEERFLRLDGTIARAEVVAMPVVLEGKPSIVVVMHDITELRSAYQRLQEEEQRLRLALSAGAMGVFETHSGKDEIHLDRIFAEMLGFSGEGMYKKEDFLKVFLPEDQERVSNLLFTDPPAPSCDGEFRFCVSDHIRWLRIVCQTLTSGDLHRVIGIAHEITEKKEAEEAMRRARERAEELNRLKGIFLAQISHELRTPIALILGYAQLLERKITSPELRTPLEYIRKGGERLLRMVNQVITLSRLEANQYPIQPRVIEVLPVVEEVVGLLEPLRARKGLELKVELPSGLKLFADPDILHQILTNLLQNALEFTEKGGVTVRGFQEGEWIVLEVSDTGPGIPEEFLPHIFEPFRQASEGPRRTHEGAGLGLAITRSFVERMGGRIELSTEEGKGTTFRVTFPFKDREEG